MTLSKTYEPQTFEDSIYNKWESSGFFTPEIDKTKRPFTIVMPPPNITGQLHLGHALDNTFQDIIIRRKRMLGYSALWLPGTDHASIATEVRIVDQLREEGLDKETIGREEFLRRAFLWKDKYGGRIVKQLRRMGSSCDWTREAFTMDERCSKAVREVFVNFYNKGLIYQGKRIINWCPSCRTALSDTEVEYAEQAGHLWQINYPLEDGTGGVVVATTRPETMLGDTAVAVNPLDERYSALVGKKLKLPLTNRLIPVVFDDYVEMEFGTGAVKITPAHDPNDFEVGERHSLEVIRIMDDSGIMNENAFAYTGLDRYEARERIIKDLAEGGYLCETKDYLHNVGQCYRCDSTVEPIVSKQWFVKMKELAAPAIEAVKKNDIRFVPPRFSKQYFHWMENIRDWCISRQLWWGHRIPVWYCDDCDAIIVEKHDPAKCPKCGSANIRQDEDVLDTWFSSALWPFSTLGYPEKTADLEYFYPTDVLVTGHDIITFWVSKMIFSGIECMGEKPFSEIVIHGLIRDALGRKMSKSLGNGVDPIELIDRYGADSLRFSLCTGVAPGTDIKFAEDKPEPARNFMNKIWNAARFVLMNIEGRTLPKIENVNFSAADKWILNSLNQVVSEVNQNLDKYEFGIAAAKLYDFIWSDYCDWFIELTKPVLYGEDEAQRDDCLAVLDYTLKTILKLLHPFTPFITEKIWEESGEKGALMLENYPGYNEKFNFAKAGMRFEAIKEIIRSVRNLKAEMNVPPSKKVKIYVLSEDAEFIKENLAYIYKLANIEDAKFIINKEEISEKTAGIVLDGAEIFVPMGDLIDTDKEIARLSKEADKARAELERSEKMLANAGFVSKAPQALIDKEKAKVEESKEILEKLITRIAELES
ncbi:MAG: valine--tRNA ligase [Clostridia bacterium]